MQSPLWHQAHHGGDFPTHGANVLRLDQFRLSLTYTGWQDDLIHAEHAFSTFNDALQGMINKEKMYHGNHSHPDLVRLDQLKQSLSYNGWQKDFLSAKQSLLAHPNDLKDHYIFKLIEKQRMHCGDRTHARLRLLDSYVFTYPGWQMDQRVAEEEHVIHIKSPWFDRVLLAMRHRQQLFDAMQRPTIATSSTSSSDSSTDEAQQQSNPKPGNCVICMSEPKTHAFIPCGHMCACEICAFEAFGRSGMCPICRKESEKVTQIFLS